MTKQEQLIEKYEEYIECAEYAQEGQTIDLVIKAEVRRIELKSEISSLKQEIEQEEKPLGLPTDKEINHETF